MAEERESKKPKTSHDDHDHAAVEKQSIIENRVKKTADDLPELVLLHVISFLDTKSLVRTSILCRRWRTLWKDTLALHLRCCSYLPSSRQHVEKLLLSLRSGRRTAVVPNTVSFDFDREGDRWTWDSGAFGLVMRYYEDATAAGSGGGLRDLSVAPGPLREDFDRMGRSIADQKNSLKSLKLVRTFFRGPFALAGFSLLTSLELIDCSFYDSGDTLRREWVAAGSAVVVLPFGDVPSLKFLKLLDCWSKDRVVVAVPQVLDLEIRNRSFLNFRIGELLAPKVESFTFSGHVRDLDDREKGCFGEPYVFPSLRHASIRLVWAEPADKDVEKMERLDRAFESLLRGMRKAKSLNLCFDKCESMTRRRAKQLNLPVEKIKSLVVDENSPFAALKTLKIQFPRNTPCDGYPVIHYSRSEDGGFVEEEFGTNGMTRFC